MSNADFIKFVWDALSADTRCRIEKTSREQKKSLDEVIVFLLSEGVNTLQPFFLPLRC